MGRTALGSTVVAVLCLLAPATASAAPPTITGVDVTEITSTSATLKAEVNPEGKPTLYHFEYGAKDCSTEPACTKIPVPDGQIAAGISPVPIEAQLQGLTPTATYHFRVVAKSLGAGGGENQSPDQVFATYLPPQEFAACPNDAFRTGEFAPLGNPSALLPDCRAYEQASPVDKNGVDAYGMITYLSNSGIPGAEGSQELPVYLASRGAGEWSTKSLLPPASYGQEAFVLGWAPDFSQVFDEAKRLSGEGAGDALLSRAGPSGPLTEVIGYEEGLKNPFFAGIGADGSEALFESTAALSSVPAALEGKSNLYLWDREAQVLHLVDVENNGASMPQGAFAGSYDWIEGSTPAALAKGGAGAGHYTQDEHVISADGDVYFTAAGSGQVYLRRNPTQPQSALDGQGKCTEPEKACTIQVSASQKTNGKGPGNHDAAGTRPAAFMGATPDGQHAFLTSSEKLTNDATTGPEPLPASIARADIGGTNKNIGFCFTKAIGIAADANHLYWADPGEGNPGEGRIGRAELNCGNPEPEYISGADNPQYVAVDSEHVYWTNAGNGEEGEGTIGRAKLGPAPAEQAEEVEEDFIEGANNPQGIAVGVGADANHLYWANAGNETDTRTIGRAKLGPSAAEEVEVGFIDIGGGLSRRTPQGIAVNATRVYAAVEEVGAHGPLTFSSVQSWELDGDISSGKAFFDGDHQGLSGVRGIALDANYVYWARQGLDTIGRVNLELEESSAEREFVKTAAHPVGVAVDGSHLYWSANQESPANHGNDLYRYDASSGALTDLTVDEADEDGAQVKGVLGTSDDGSYVYFAANGVLASGAAAGDCGGTVGAFINYSGQCSLYLAHEGEPTRFIARLDASGPDTDALNWLPHGLIGQVEKTARVSADGHVVLFRSQRQLTAYKNGGTPELYRYRLGDLGPTCVSCNPTGQIPTGPPTLASVSLPVLTLVEPAVVLSRNLSAAGDRVFFESSDRLVVGDTNGVDGCPRITQYQFPTCQDVYEWEAKGSGSCFSEAQNGGCLHLLSSGTSETMSFFADASVSGDDAFFLTRSPGLVGQDQDGIYDVYDAHVGGGLAAQNQAPAEICESAESCRPTTSTPPGVESPNTATFSGPTPKPRKPTCPKHGRRGGSKGKHRCGPKKHHRHKHKRYRGHGQGAKRSGGAVR